MRRLKVVSNGTSAGTKIVDAETGEDLHLPVTTIRWEISAGASRLNGRFGFDPTEATASIDFGLIGAEVLGSVSDATRERWVAVMRDVFRGAPSAASAALSACPFCGNPAVAIEDRTIDARTFIMYAYCGDCGAHGPHYNAPDRDTVTRLWNTRAADAELLRFVREVADTAATSERGVASVLNAYIDQATAILRERADS